MSSELLIGTIGSPAMLAGDFANRKRLVDSVVDAGIDHLFIADHVSFHTGLGMDGMVNAATLAAMNPDIRVCLGVYLLALRHPVPVARQLVTLNQSAPGRIIFGVGIGGEDRHEMEVCGVDPSSRGARTNHCLAAVRALLEGKPVSYHCEFFEFENAVIKPAVTPAISMLIGGRSDAALKRAARFGEGWLAVWCSAKRFREATDQVHMIAAKSNRNFTQWQHGLQVWVGFDNDRNKARQILAEEMQAFYQIPFQAFEKYSPYGSAEEVAAFLQPYVEQGARILNIKPCAASEDAAIAGVAEVARLLKREN